MKRNAIAALLLGICLLFSACNTAGVTENTRTDYSEGTAENVVSVPNTDSSASQTENGDESKPMNNNTQYPEFDFEKRPLR